MANYEGWARSNYFKVKDLEEFKKFLEERDIDLLGESEDGTVAIYPRYNDGCWPSSNIDEEGEEVEFDLVAELAPHLAEGQVAVLMGVGHEKLRYLAGSATAVAWDGRIKCLYLSDIYALAAKEFGASSISRAEY